MRLIDADALRSVIEEEAEGLETLAFQLASTAFINHIEEAQTVPAIVPVRCHECIHDMNCGAQPFIGYSGMCYCSSGERKEGQ